MKIVDLIEKKKKNIALTKEEISKLIGRKFDDVFIPKQNGENEEKKWLDFSAECDRRIASGEPLDKIFEYYDNFMLKYKKYCKVENEDYACNFYFQNKGILVKNQWFDDVEDFWEGFAKVQLNGYANVIDMNGEYRSVQWFDDLTIDEGVSEYGLILVYNEGKHNVLNAKTKKLISDIWFDDYDWVDEDSEESNDGEIIMKFLTSERKVFYMDTLGQLHDSLNENKKKKMKTIIISESQAKRLKKILENKNKNMTEEAFICHVKSYLKQLLRRPQYAQPDEFLKANGLDGKTLLSHLVDNDIVIKKTKIESSGDKDRFNISYKVPRDNFEERVLKLYSELFENNINENVNKSETQQLLAPNGRPSNLPPELWKLVRTPQFKAWFGDWEDSPKTASKMVDENGEPLVMIHNTYNEFTKFEPNRSIAKNGAIWFADAKAQPHISGYETNINKPIIQMHCFLRIMNPSYDPSGAHYAKEDGFDGVICRSEEVEGAVGVVYSPNQIKSVNNFGDFSLDSDDINEGCVYEDGAAGVGVAGATNCNGSSGAFVQPVFPMMRRSIKTKPKTEDINEEAVMDTAIGDFGYDAPPFKKKKKDPAYDHKNMMKKSFRRK